MPNVFVSDIECYYLTKNVLKKIRQNKFFNNLHKCAANSQGKKKSNCILYWIEWIYFRIPQDLLV